MAKPRAFISGIAGFAGSHLAEELLGAGYDVAGSVLPGESLINLASAGRRVKTYRLNILEAGRCRALMKRLRPDFIFHLAAMASVGKSFGAERQTYRVNFEGTLNLLEACSGMSQLKRFLFVSSCDCYGVFKPKQKTLSEEHPLNPVSPYAVSKAAAEQLCKYHFRQYGVPVVIARSFNHSGPRQNPSFVIPSFARQIAMVEANRQKPKMMVGDLSVRRDISDVRDIATGYRLLAERGRVGEVYNLCSGRAVSIRSILDRLLRFSSRSIAVSVDQKRLRKIDIPCLRGSNHKVVQELGLKARYTLTSTLRDTLDSFRKELGVDERT
ncbi:MAG: GDP-mannose 4,6-dehydratase [Candidatus Zixiibacteriota bacterium]